MFREDFEEYDRKKCNQKGNLNKNAGTLAYIARDFFSVRLLSSVWLYSEARRSSNDWRIQLLAPGRMSWRIAFLFALQAASEPALAPYLCFARFRFCICHKTMSDGFFVLYQLPCHFGCSCRTLELDCATRTHLLRSKAVVVKAPFNEVGSCTQTTNDPTGPNYFMDVCMLNCWGFPTRADAHHDDRGKGRGRSLERQAWDAGSVVFTSSV